MSVLGTCFITVSQSYDRVLIPFVLAVPIHDKTLVLPAAGVLMVPHPGAAGGGGATLGRALAPALHILDLPGVFPTEKVLPDSRATERTCRERQFSPMLSRASLCRLCHLPAAP